VFTVASPEPSTLMVMEQTYTTASSDLESMDCFCSKLPDLRTAPIRSNVGIADADSHLIESNIESCQAVALRENTPVIGSPSESDVEKVASTMEDINDLCAHVARERLVALEQQMESLAMGVARERCLRESSDLVFAERLQVLTGLAEKVVADAALTADTAARALAAVSLRNGEPMSPSRNSDAPPSPSLPTPDQAAKDSTATPGPMDIGTVVEAHRAQLMKLTEAMTSLGKGVMRRVEKLELESEAQGQLLAQFRCVLAGTERILDMHAESGDDAGETATTDIPSATEGMLVAATAGTDECATPQTGGGECVTPPMSHCKKAPVVHPTAMEAKYSRVPLLVRQTQERSPSRRSWDRSVSPCDDDEEPDKNVLSDLRHRAAIAEAERLAQDQVDDLRKELVECTRRATELRVDGAALSRSASAAVPALIGAREAAAAVAASPAATSGRSAGRTDRVDSRAGVHTPPQVKPWTGAYSTSPVGDDRERRPRPDVSEALRARKAPPARADGTAVPFGHSARYPGRRMRSSSFKQRRTGGHTASKGSSPDPARSSPGAEVACQDRPQDQRLAALSQDTGPTPVESAPITVESAPTAVESALLPPSPGCSAFSFTATSCPDLEPDDDSSNREDTVVTLATLPLYDEDCSDLRNMTDDVERRKLDFQQWRTEHIRHRVLTSGDTTSRSGESFKTSSTMAVSTAGSVSEVLRAAATQQEHVIPPTSAVSSSAISPMSRTGTAAVAGMTTVWPPETTADESQPALAPTQGGCPWAASCPPPPDRLEGRLPLAPLCLAGGKTPPPARVQLPMCGEPGQPPGTPTSRHSTPGRTPAGSSSICPTTHTRQAPQSTVQQPGQPMQLQMQASPSSVLQSACGGPPSQSAQVVMQSAMRPTAGQVAQSVQQVHPGVQISCVRTHSRFTS